MFKDTILLKTKMKRIYNYLSHFKT